MPDTFFAAIFVGLLLALVALVANVLVWVRLLPDGSRYTNHWHATLRGWTVGRPSRRAAWAWMVSISSAWLGPLMALTGPAALIWGLWLRRELRRVPANRATRVAVTMAVLNGCFFTTLAVALAVLWWWPAGASLVE